MTSFKGVRASLADTELWARDVLDRTKILERN